MHITYEPKGICARKVEFDIEDGVVKNISFLGGCTGRRHDTGRSCKKNARHHLRPQRYQLS